MRISVDLADPENPVVIAALTRKCGCGAKPGETCVSILPRPFPDKRLVHYVRVEQWDIA